MMRSRIEEDSTFQRLGLPTRRYGLLTLHRPSNVDDPKILSDLCQVLARISLKMPLVFSVHPRTAINLERFGLAEELQSSSSIHLLDPLFDLIPNDPLLSSRELTDCVHRTILRANFNLFSLRSPQREKFRICGTAAPQKE